MINPCLMNLLRFHLSDIPVSSLHIGSYLDWLTTLGDR
ncbi:hypothetical protein MJ1HA_1472 [Metallosphaera sedula]|nr:hypothetical protein MJ1HA_1472 [Metallosphaera sedula]